MDKHEKLPLGVVLEWRRSDNPWIDHTWMPVAVIPGAPPCDPRDAWTLLQQGEGWSRYHCGTLPLQLFRKETEGYKVNLAQEPPRLFVVLRGVDDAECEHDVVPVLVTACPYEAQDYLDSGEEIVEAVPMPPDVVAFVQAYIDQHHVDVPFHKRKRKRLDPEQVGFGRKAPAGSRGGGHHG